MQLRRFIFLLVIGTTAVLVFLFFSRRTIQADYGPAVALCPGPDAYGYRCESGERFSYHDAKTDIFLYKDDGTETRPLPFPFTFYGTTYAEITISSNGNVQFGGENPTFANACLDEQPVAEMGDMIAPFWDDLDLLVAGTVDIDTIGVAPNRVFIVEWDNVPYKDTALDERVTFALHLFEGSNDIVFLYEDVRVLNGRNGQSATIGIQSATQGLALQFSCNQPGVADATQLAIRHPETPNANIGQSIVVAPAFEPPPLSKKSWLPDLTAQLNTEGKVALTRWRQQRLSQPAPQLAEWVWADVTGSGRSDLIIALNSTIQTPERSALLVFTVDEAGQFAPALYQPLTDRDSAVAHIDHLQSADLTHDGVLDVLFKLRETDQFVVLTQHEGDLQLQSVPERCSGSWLVMALEESGRLALVRDGCETPGRSTVLWRGGQFEPIKK